MLMDIVAKNGNLMLNIPVRGDGTIDSDELDFLHDLAAWMKVNEEAIFKSRPWTIYGEGPVRMAAGGFSEGGENKLTAQDIRFTTKGDVLYATAMGWPESGRITIRTLAAGAPGIAGDIAKVRLLGHGEIAFTRTAEGLTATLPYSKPCEYIYILKIEGLDLKRSDPAQG
jgi:alpha-L-fucosidase